MNVADLADEIFRELDQPSDLTTSSISFWLVSNTGKLNILLDIDIVIVSSEFSPLLTDSEADIYKVLFEVDYYNRQVRTNLGAAAYTSIAEFKEGGRTVRKVNKTEIAKAYASALKDKRSELEQLILQFKANQLSVLDVYVRNPQGFIFGSFVP